MSTSRTASLISGTSSAGPWPARCTSSTSHEGSASRRVTTPDLPGAIVDRAALEIVGPPLVVVELGRGLAGYQKLGSAQRLGGAAVSASVQADDRPRVEAGAADDPALVAADVNGRAVDQQLGDALGDVEASVEPVGTPNGPSHQPALGIGQASTMSTNTRRLSRAAAALITVRSALAVRPPRPITLP